MLLIILGYFLVVRPWQDSRTEVVVVTERIERPELNIAFEFKSGENAYSYVEPPVTDEMRTTGLKAAFILMDTDDYIGYQAGLDGGEAPKSISVFVYTETEPAATSTPRLDRLNRIRAWAETHSALTSFSLAQGTPEEVVLDGVKAIRYRADGLYPQEVYIAFYSGNYYLIVGQYDGEKDPMYSDFLYFVNSINFL